MDRQVIIIDKNRLGIFNLKSMAVNQGSLGDFNISYELEIEADTVLNSKNIKRKIEKIIQRRRKYEKKTKR